MKQFIRQFRTIVLNSLVSEISRKVKSSKLTYLSYQKLINLENCIKDISRKNVPGNFIEAGVALGGSAIVISTLMPKDRTFHGYDVFEMIPPPSTQDNEKAQKRYEVIKSGQSKGIGDDVYYGYLENLYEIVNKNLNNFGVNVDGNRICLHKGLFQDTMNFTPEDKVAMIHIDCDWYEPVYFCLNKIYPVLSTGGYIILDDYYDYGGCKKATEEFLANYRDLTVVKDNSNLVLQRK